MLHQRVLRNDNKINLIDGLLYILLNPFFQISVFRGGENSTYRKWKRKETTKYHIGFLKDKANEYSVLGTFSTIHKPLRPMQFSTKSHQSIHHNTLESLEALECGEKLLSQLPVVIIPWSWSGATEITSILQWREGRGYTFLPVLPSQTLSKTTACVVGIVNGCWSSFQNVARISSLFLLLFILLLSLPWFGSFVFPATGYLRVHLIAFPAFHVSLLWSSLLSCSQNQCSEM